jgi:cysteine desulfurase/selenocysteine lyase
MELGLENVQEHEHKLVEYALPRLHTVPGLTIVGPDTTEARGGTISFSLGAIHPHDIGQYLDELGIAVRVGHHCARPTCVRFGVPATTRVSFYLYSTEAEIDALIDGLNQVVRFFG